MPRRCGGIGLFLGLLGSLLLFAVYAGQNSAGQISKEELTRKLWPRSRIVAALQRIKELRALGMMSEDHYRRKKAMLEARLAGTFHPTMLSVTNPPLNLLQNGGFEEINRNSRPDRSRWLWWNGWSWGGQYENHWEDRPQYVHSGRYSARIRCLGKPGRIGIMTPKIPAIGGATEYEFSVWVKGEGENRLFINFESGAHGSLRKQIGPKWEHVKVRGKLDPGAHDFMVYIYSIGRGTLWLDDARLVPIFQKKSETKGKPKTEPISP